MGKFVVTGGPGVGKTSVVNLLSGQGYTILPETAREIIAREQKKEEDYPGYKAILPWTDLEKFQDLYLDIQLLQEATILKKDEDVFLDRSLVDPIAYVELGNVGIRKDIHQLIENADYSRVFFLDRLPNYEKDEERKEDLETALRLHDKLYEVYDRLGFDIVEVPVFDDLNVEEGVRKRVEFMLDETNFFKDEIEKKYKVNHSLVRRALANYQVNHVGTDHEDNRIYDYKDLLLQAGYLLRIRDVNDKHVLTVKGPNKSQLTKMKPEYNLSVPGVASFIAKRVLPQSVSYQKTRANYRPLGDSRCVISLDYLHGHGEFVEIEAATENQVLLWEKRLGIAKYAVKESYPELVKNSR